MTSPIESLPVSDIKSRFAQGTILTEESFSQLIELADYSRKLVGQPSTDKSFAVDDTGLSTANDGLLSVNVDGASLTIIEGKITASTGISTGLSANTLATLMKIEAGAEYANLVNMENGNHILFMGKTLLGGIGVASTTIDFVATCFNVNSMPYTPFGGDVNITLNGVSGTRKNRHLTGFKARYDWLAVKQAANPADIIEIELQPPYDTLLKKVQLQCENWLE